MMIGGVLEQRLKCPTCEFARKLTRYSLRKRTFNFSKLFRKKLAKRSLQKIFFLKSYGAWNALDMRKTVLKFRILDDHLPGEKPVSTAHALLRVLRDSIYLL